MIEPPGKLSRAIFSGRFDPPHPGHIAQIFRILKIYDSVTVVVLKHPGRNFPTNYCMSVFKEIFAKSNVEVISNEVHFGEISFEEVRKYGDLWIGGNLSVLRHMEHIGFPGVYIERAYDYEAHKYERIK